MRHHSTAPISFTLFFVVCVVGAALTQTSVATVVAGIPIVWTPVGLIAAALSLSPSNRWPALIALGYVATTAPLVAHNHVLLPDAVFTAVSMAEAVLAGALLRSMITGQFDLSQLSHVTAFYVVAGVAPIVGAVAALAGVRLTSSGPLVVDHAWFMSWITDVLGILLGAPLVFGWSRYPDGIVSPPRWRLVEGIAVLVAVVLVSEGVFGEMFPRPLQAPAVLMPLLLVAVFRFGPVGIVAALLMASLVALPNTLLGLGPYAGLGTPVMEALLRGKVIATTSTVSFLLLASTVAERRRIAHERTALIAELQQALVEIKTLRGFIPICAWCHKVRDDAGFWEGIEAYLQRHTDAVFSHGICPSCSAREHLALETAQARELDEPPATA